MIGLILSCGVPNKVTHIKHRQFSDYFREQQSSSSIYSEFERNGGCSKDSYPTSMDGDLMLGGTPEAEDAAVVVVIVGGAIDDLNGMDLRCYWWCSGGGGGSFETPASGSKTPSGQQMVRPAALAVEAAADAVRQKRRSRGSRHKYWTYVRRLLQHESDESKRPDPKSIMVEQGLHPHPGPGAELDAASVFEYCCRYTFARWKAAKQVPGGPILTSIWGDPYWKIAAEAAAHASSPKLKLHASLSSEPKL